MPYTLLNPFDPAWPAQIDALCAQLGAPANPTLFPPQFLQVTLPKIGGHVIVCHAAGALAAVGFLFPRAIRDGKRAYTLRFHQVGGQAVDAQEMAAAAQAELGGGEIVVYDPHASQQFAPTHHPVGAFDIGAPDADEAAAIRALQREVWGATDGFLYPSDLHSVAFSPGTSLVARADGQVIAFLFGFFRFGAPESTPAWATGHRTELRIESQTLGVASRYRRAGLGVLLKRRQAELAVARGIDIIHWTVDPLQLPNGVLNFNKLGGVAFDFYASYYPFRNALNQLPASRFSISWLLRSSHVAQRLASRQSVPRLADFGPVQVLNTGPIASSEPASASAIAIEIPVDWTALQACDLAAAAQWRTTTDALLARSVSSEENTYRITDVAMEGERAFLIGRRNTALLSEE